MKQEYTVSMYVNKNEGETFATQREILESTYCELDDVHCMVDEVICKNILIDKIAIGFHTHGYYVNALKRGVKITGLSVTYKNNHVSYIEANKYDITDSDFKLIKQSASKYLKSEKTVHYREMCARADIDPDAENLVRVTTYRDYKPESEKLVNGKFEDIVYEVEAYNEHMKYINGSYKRISDPIVEQAAQALRDISDNYYLDVAVRMGVIID